MLFGLFKRKKLVGNASDDKAISNYLTKHMKVKEEDLSNLTFQKFKIPKKERVGN